MFVEIFKNLTLSFRELRGSFNALKIVVASILMGFIFQFLLHFFQYELAFGQKVKSFYLILSALLGLASYFLICYFIKAFKISDIQLRY